MVRLAPLLLLALVGSAAAARELQGMDGKVGAMVDGAKDVAGAAVGAVGDVAGAMGDYVHESIQGLKSIHEAKVGCSTEPCSTLLCSPVALGRGEQPAAGLLH